MYDIYIYVYIYIYMLTFGVYLMVHVTILWHTWILWVGNRLIIHENSHAKLSSSARSHLCLLREITKLIPGGGLVDVATDALARDDFPREPTPTKKKVCVCVYKYMYIYIIHIYIYILCVCG